MQILRKMMPILLFRERKLSELTAPAKATVRGDSVS